MDNSNKKQKLEYINYYRGLAILLIVASHSLLWGKPNEEIRRSMEFICQGGTWLFVFIAGFLFQYLSYKFDLKTFYKKKLINLVCPYIVTMTPAVISCVLFNDNIKIPFHGMSKLVQIPSYYAFGFILNFPLWFMGMILIIFLAAPLFLYINKSKLSMYLSLFISLSGTMYFGRSATGFKLHGDVTLIHRYFAYVLFYLKSALFFLSVFLLGMFICRYIEKNQDKIKFIAQPILFCSSVMMLFLYILYVFKHGDFGHEIIRMTEIIFLLSLFICAENYIKSIGWLDKTLKFLAQYSFGIFFVHKYFVYILNRHSLYFTPGPNLIDTFHNSSSSLLNALLMFSFAMFGSIAVLWFIKKALNKIGIKNTRMFIGVDNK